MKAIVRIPNISWRDGRPRFNPGPKLRKLGFKGEDLRHGAGADVSSAGKDGDWFTLRETEDWAKAKSEEITRRRAQARQKGRKIPPLGGEGRTAKPAGVGGYTIEALFDDLWRSKHFQSKAASTQRDYRMKAEAFAKFEPHLWGVLARDMTPAAVHGLHEKLWAAKGLAMANGMVAVMRLAYSIARKRGAGGVRDNPCRELGLPTPKPRLRCASAQEIAALMAAADAIEPSVGDAIALALFTGQRQGDVLALTEAGMSEGRIKLRQRKTGAVVSVQALAPLIARLAAIRERNRLEGRVTPTIVAHPRTGRAWNADNFRHRYADVRALAKETCESVADFHFADLRDTAVTWLHRAGCDIAEIASVTGHSEKTVYTILKHYLVIDETTNDRAMTKLGAWLDKEGVRV
ncbi:tyrosine-type recombinase/integrase [Methylocystis sp.]|uniref:tyrosine-type recombinase/integrase n=1 Tax=Methylocystis sp. TaxID=1911079 RepID=UPI002735E61B|nr:tyrosine-type recombinase/integrase [Methylocystis sp.]MDP3554859.1 tyrosine-type recombinase/integrase [Methylocystis sp.]